MARKEKIESKNPEFNGMDLYDEKFVYKLHKSILQKYPNAKIEKDGGVKIPLINNNTPVFDKGNIVDHGGNGRFYTGNILYFLEKHPVSPFCNKPDELGKFIGISKEKMEEYISANFRYRDKKSKFSLDTIVSNFTPNYFYEKIIKGKKTRVQYLESRGINRDIIEREDIYDLTGENLEEVESILKNSQEDYIKMMGLKLREIEMTQLSSNLKYPPKKTDVIEFYKTKIKIYSDFIVNANVSKAIKKELLEAIVKIIQENKENLKDEDYSSINSFEELVQYLLKQEKNENWFEDYFPYTVKNLEEFPIVFPYKSPNGQVESITFRTKVARKDGRKYVQYGASTVELNIKQRSKLIILIEGKVDKLSLLTMIKNLNLKESEFSFVTFLNANMPLPYEVIEALKQDPKLSVINMLDNDMAGKAANAKIFSRLYNQEFIERVHDFSSFLEDRQIENNDINDFLNNPSLGSNEFMEFLKTYRNYQKKQINNDVTRTSAIYLKSFSELKSYIEDSKRNQRSDTVYIKYKDSHYDVTQSIQTIANDLYNGISPFDKKNRPTVTSDEVEEVFNKQNLQEQNVMFLVKDKKYQFKDVKKSYDKIFLVENPNNPQVQYRGVFELANIMYEKNGEMINKYVEQFIFDGADMAYQFRCEEKLPPVKTEEMRTGITKEQFSKWWRTGVKTMLDSTDWSSNEIKEALIYETEIELRLALEFSDLVDNSDDFFNFFIEYNNISKELRNRGILTGLRGSAGNFLSFSLFKWTNYSKRQIEFLLKNRKIAMPQRFLNKNKVEMPDIDTEYSKFKKEQAAEVFREFNYYLPLVIKHLKTGETNVVNHPVGYTKIPDYLKEFMTEASQYLPDSVEEINSNFKNDGLPQNIEREENYEEEIELKLKDVLFKSLPQVTKGAQEALLHQKGLEFPVVEYIDIYEEGQKNRFFIKSRNEAGFAIGSGYIDEQTGEGYTYQQLKEKFSQNAMRGAAPNNIKKYSIFNEMEQGSFNSKIFNEVFPEEYKKIVKILNQETNLEEMMLATSTNRPAFTGSMFEVDNKAYLITQEEDTETKTLIDMQTGDEVQNRTIFPTEVIKDIERQLPMEEKTSKITITKKDYKGQQTVTKGIPSIKISAVDLSEKQVEEISNLIPQSVIIGEVKKYKTQVYIDVDMQKFGENEKLPLWEYIQENKVKLITDNMREQDVSKTRVYEYLQEQRTTRNWLSYLNFSNGFILYQEQMMLFILDIAEQYVEARTDLTEEQKKEFLKSWSFKTESVRKFSSKTNKQISKEFREEIDQIFVDIEEKLLPIIEDNNQKFAQEVQDVISKQLNILKTGAYLYNFHHGMYVGDNALQEGKYRMEKSLLNDKNKTIVLETEKGPQRFVNNGMGQWINTSGNMKIEIFEIFEEKVVVTEENQREVYKEYNIHFDPPRQEIDLNNKNENGRRP